MNLANWFQRIRTDRRADVARVIADAPTTVAWYRRGVSQGSLTVRLVNSAMQNPQMGNASSANLGNVTVFAEVGTAFQAGDRLQAPGGTIYSLLYVYPRQEWRTVAFAEVVSR